MSRPGFEPLTSCSIGGTLAKSYLDILRCFLFRISTYLPSAQVYVVVTHELIPEAHAECRLLGIKLKTAVTRMTRASEYQAGQCAGLLLLVRWAAVVSALGCCC
jgi:hypothetical protein